MTAGDASRLLTCSADRTARVMKLPLSKSCGEGTDLIGHNAAVLSATWSHDGTMVGCQGGCMDGVVCMAEPWWLTV